MKLILFVTILFLPFLCSSNNDVLTEQEIFNKVIAAINSGSADDISESEYDQISEFISSGNRKWIDLYPMLNKKPFIGMTSFQEGLNISMAYALTESPSEVLKFVNERNVDYICGIPFIEPTQNEVNTYYEKAKEKIMAVNQKLLWKNKCLFTMDRIVASEIVPSNK